MEEIIRCTANRICDWTKSLFPDHNTPTVVEQGRLKGFTEEAPYIAEKRKQSIAYLRSFTPSKYVLDGAKIELHKPTVLVPKHETTSTNPT